MEMEFCFGSLCIVAIMLVALLWLGRTAPGPKFPGFNEFLKWWNKGKLPALIFLASHLFRGGMWAAIGVSATGGTAVIVTVCEILDWPEIYQWLVRPTFEFFRWLVE